MRGPVTDEARRDIVDARVETLREIVARRGAGAIVLRTRRDFAWLTLGGSNHVLMSTETGVAPIVITPDDAVVLAPVNEHARLVDEELRGLPLRALSLPWWDDEAAARETNELTANPAILEVEDVADEVERLRTRLAPLEHQRMAALADEVNAVVGDALEHVGAGDTEEDLAGALVGRLTAAGARVPVLLVAADDRIDRYRHPIPTSTAIRGRVMAVVVAERWGLHVAATQFRELVPRPAPVEARAAAISDVLARMRAQTVPGNTFGDVFAAARAAYADNGMADEWTLHHQGGSIGYAARERIATPDDQTAIGAGMAFAWNPSAVGYKAEETLYLDDDGAQHVLTTTRT
jgi:Xaa-Pro dipeptidase